MARSAGATDEVTRTEPPDEIRAVPVRRPGRWIAAAIVAVIGVSIANSVITNPNFEWGVVGDFLFDHRILHGVVVTLELTVIAMVKGAVPGFLGPTGRGGERVEARCGARGRRPVTEK